MADGSLVAWTPEVICRCVACVPRPWAVVIKGSKELLLLARRTPFLALDHRPRSKASVAATATAAVAVIALALVV